MPAKKVDLVPFYNKDLHPAGTLVKSWIGGKLVEFVVPELDADNQVLPESNPGRLTVKKVNVKKPKFRPMPKPSKKRK